MQHSTIDKIESTATSKPIPSTERIFQAVRELRAMDQIATRDTVAELTGLKLSVVDDRLRTLVDDGKLKRLLRGVYELVESFPEPRAISKTVLPNGAVVYDIGDEVLTLSPQEARVLAEAAGQQCDVESGLAHAAHAAWCALARLELMLRDEEAWKCG